MEDKNFYTIEGKLYLVKTISKTTNFPVVLNSVIPEVRINTGATANGYQLYFETAKKIIPICLNYTANDTISTSVDITSIYYRTQSQGSFNYIGINCMLKMIPFANKIFVDSFAKYQFGIDYKQPVLSEFDFMDPTIGLQLTFSLNLGSTLTNNGNLGSFDLLGNEYEQFIAFTYLELQG